MIGWIAAAARQLSGTGPLPRPACQTIRIPWMTGQGSVPMPRVECSAHS